MTNKPTMPVLDIPDALEITEDVFCRHYNGFQTLDLNTSKDLLNNGSLVFLMFSKALADLEEHIRELYEEGVKVTSEEDAE